MIKILIVDDHPVVRKGIKLIISQTKDIVVMGEAGNIKELIEIIDKDNFDIILLDISLPDNNGLEIIKKIKILKPSIQILIHTMHPEDQLGVKSFKAGASGYLNKACDSERVIEAIRVISSGRLFISDKTFERLYRSGKEGQSNLKHEILSFREHEVMLLINEGKSIKEIGNMLGLSSKTVSTYHKRILEKMGLNNDAELIAYSIKNKLIDIKIK